MLAIQLVNTQLWHHGIINFEDTIRLLKLRGNAMQSAVPKGEGGMVAVLGSDILKIENSDSRKNINVSSLMTTLMVNL